MFIYKYIHKCYVFIEMTILPGFNNCKKRKEKKTKRGFDRIYAAWRRSCERARSLRARPRTTLFVLLFNLSATARCWKLLPLLTRLGRKNDCVDPPLTDSSLGIHSRPNWKYEPSPGLFTSRRLSGILDRRRSHLSPVCDHPASSSDAASGGQET